PCGPPQPSLTSGDTAGAASPVEARTVRDESSARAWSHADAGRPRPHATRQARTSTRMVGTLAEPLDRCKASARPVSRYQPVPHGCLAREALVAPDRVAPRIAHATQADAMEPGPSQPMAQLEGVEELLPGATLDPEGTVHEVVLRALEDAAR